MNKIRIIILAAGHGKRMKSELPKVLIPLKGKPLISHVLDSVKETGLCDRPVVVVGQQRELVMKTLGENYEYVIQEEQLGTGHAVMSAKKILENTANHIVVLYGDHPFISSATIKKLAAKHLDSNNSITMATVRLKNFDGWRNVFYANFSRIIRGKNGNIIKDVQFKDATDEEKKITEVNPCYFCFNAKWLWEKLKSLGTDNAQKEYYLTDLVKIAMHEKKIESINIDPYEALGVNSKEELKILEKLAI
ncbi:NTP transferase domain-containing protein [Candidatus Nomurabacteria bacterium]|nr:NTP transferase domain-containing protein [Candidatus Nomurabacteria bacterium]